jgi:hypothetical protein
VSPRRSLANGPCLRALTKIDDPITNERLDKSGVLVHTASS